MSKPTPQALAEAIPLSRPVCAASNGGHVCTLLAPHPGLKHISSKGKTWS